MPCSRSARRPSVSSDRSTWPLPLRRRLASATWSSWSSRTALESKSSRPISVDLPSSTEPAVASLRLVVLSEIAGNLAILHRGLGDAVVGTRLAAFGDAGPGDLVDDVGQRDRGRLDRARAAHVADRAVAHERAEDVLLGQALDVVGGRVEHAVAAEDLALVGEVDVRDLELLAHDVLPHVELRPVAQREHADVLAAADAGVVEVPQLRALALGVPAAEVVAEREHALLGPGALLVTARAAERGVELVLGDRVEQRRGLEPVARGARPDLLDDAAVVDRLLDGGDDQPLAELLDHPVAELEDLGEVVARVHVHQWKREAAGAERLQREVHHHDGVLAAAEEENGVLPLGRDLAHHEDGLGLELTQVVHAGATSVARSVGRWAAARARLRCRTNDARPARAGTPTMVQVGRSTPAFVNTPSAEPSR